jgi:hypothetical protein
VSHCGYLAVRWWCWDSEQSSWLPLSLPDVSQAHLGWQENSLSAQEPPTPATLALFQAGCETVERPKFKMIILFFPGHGAAPTNHTEAHLPCCWHDCNSAQYRSKRGRTSVSSLPSLAPPSFHSLWVLIYANVLGSDL